MNASIILVGSALLILIAIVVGVDKRAREAAWRSIAAERRANSEDRQRLTTLLAELTEEAAVCPCRVCRTLRRMFGREVDGD